MAQRLSEDSTDVCLSPLYVTLIVRLSFHQLWEGGRQVSEGEGQARGLVARHVRPQIPAHTPPTTERCPVMLSTPPGHEKPLL